LIEKHGKDFNVGYDAAKGEYTDMIKAGILEYVLPLLLHIRER